jgi:hypothetical protein
MTNNSRLIALWSELQVYQKFSKKITISGELVDSFMESYAIIGVR